MVQGVAALHLQRDARHPAGRIDYATLERLARKCRRQMAERALEKQFGRDVAGGLMAEAVEPGRIFRLEPKPGSAWTLEATTSIGTSTTVLGKDLDVGLHERLEATLVVERVNPDGSSVVLLHVDRLQGIQRSGDEDDDLVDYDSAGPPGATSADKVWKEFRARGESIVGRRWRLVLRPDGMIDDVSADADGIDAEPDPPRTFSVAQDPPVELDGRLVFDAARGDFLEAAWEGELRSQAAVWWLLGKKLVMDIRFALRVSPAPAAKATQIQAVRPLPAVR